MEVPLPSPESNIHATRGLELLSVSGFAIAQPLYDVVGRHPDFLVAHGFGRGEILLLSLLLSFAIPMLGMALEGTAGFISSRLASASHALLLASGMALVALQLTSKLESLPASAGIGISLAIGGLAAAAVERIPMFASFVRLLSVVALLFPLLFLFGSPMRALTLVEESGGRAASKIERPVPIVVLVLDELPLISLLDREGGIDRTRTPRLARFADTATYFPRTASGASYTTTALPMLLTGRHPDEYGIAATHSSFPNNLFSLLAQHYDIESFEAITQICPPEICENGSGGLGRVVGLLPDLSILYLHLTLPSALRDRLPPVTQNWRDFAGEAEGETMHDLSASDLMKERVLKLGQSSRSTTRDFSAFVSRITSDRPRETLYLFHLLLPHPYWRTLPTGQRYFQPSNIIYGLPLIWEDRWESVQSYQRHLLQVGFTDRMIGTLLDRLVEVGIYDDALIAIIADHGVSFRYRDRRRDFTPTNSAETMLVPFLLKLPGQIEPVVIDRPTQTVDLVPLIADAIGAEIPWQVDGFSTLDPDAPRRSEYTTTQGDGSRKLYPVVEVDAVLKERLEHKLSIFNRYPGADALYAIGPMPELIGKKVSEFRMAGQPAAMVSWIEEVERLDDVDPRATIVPTLISGAVLGPAAPGRPMNLAIALNGTIRATTTTFDHKTEKAFFMAMVSPNILVEGVNRPSVFRLDARDGSVVLQLIRSSDPTRWQTKKGEPGGPSHSP